VRLCAGSASRATTGLLGRRGAHPGHPVRLPFRQRVIPRPSRMRSPGIPGCSRQSPHDDGRKDLLTPRIPAYPRSTRRRHDRPVTPEVAGSSPVAPAKVPANRHIVLSQQTPDLRRLHRPFRSKTRNGQKTARNRSPGCRVQADSGRVETVRQGGVQLYETTGGHGRATPRHWNEIGRSIRAGPH
jgi:hypothetical protein